jgi:hypothetical protein
MKQPISVTMRKIGRWPIKKQYEHLQALKDAEPYIRSKRRIEIEAELGKLLQRDMNAGKRGLRRNHFSERQSQERVNECA